jgi:transcriptional regulator with XRE-family HTH domain
MLAGVSFKIGAVMPESLGQRLARLRVRNGLTQQALADRLALSRVAISHFEMGQAVPSERTIILLAGLFRCEPHELVDDTFYPLGKALRLPPIAPRYTEVELQLALLERDLEWCARAPERAGETMAAWARRLLALQDGCADEREQALIGQALGRLRQLRAD